jgi:hypothetical protein
VVVADQLCVYDHYRLGLWNFNADFGERKLSGFSLGAHDAWHSNPRVSWV